MSRLQFITTNATDAERACKGGVRWIQLRIKNVPDNEWKVVALEVKKVCGQYNSKLIINDNAELAKLVGADGVHLGKDDMSPDAARKILGEGYIIGGTANTIGDVRRLNKLKVNYIGLGPFRFTATKENLSPVLGLEGYQDIMRQCAAENLNIPVIAIGGIQLSDIETIMETGIYGIAVSSAIINNKDVEDTAKCFIEKIIGTGNDEKRFANYSR